MIVESCLDKGSLCSCNRDLNKKNHAGNNLELIKKIYNVASKGLNGKLLHELVLNDQMSLMPRIERFRI